LSEVFQKITGLDYDNIRVPLWEEDLKMTKVKIPGDDKNKETERPGN
jgi:hypothetical protein